MFDLIIALVFAVAGLTAIICGEIQLGILWLIGSVLWTIVDKLEEIRDLLK